jgi:arginine/lysine/ornithine decarboxylase
MLAIRSYSISPEYFFMKYKAFEEIDKNRLMFNIVSGDIQKTETSVEDLVISKEHLDTSQKRVEYTKMWMNKLVDIFNSYVWNV